MRRTILVGPLQPQTYSPVNANAISYICGRQYPGCHCRSSTVLNNGGQIGDGDLDVATVVAAMEIAEQDEAQVMHYEPWMMVMRPSEELQQQPQQSRPPRAQPAIHARVMPPTRAARLGTPMPATPRPATPMPVRHTQPIPGVLPNEAGQLQRYYVWPARRASALNQLNQAALARPRRPARPSLYGMPVTPIRSAI